MQLMLELKSPKKLQILGSGGLSYLYCLASYLPRLTSTSTSPILSSAHLLEGTEYLWVKVSSGKATLFWRFKGRSGLTRNRQQRHFYTGQSSSRKELEKTSRPWRISAPANATTHRVTGPHTLELACQIRQPSLQAALQGPLNEVIMCAVPHRAFQVTRSHSSAFNPHAFSSQKHCTGRKHFVQT